MIFYKRVLLASLGILFLSGEKIAFAQDSEASRLETTSVPGVFKFTWQGKVGRSYFIQNSFDLQSWITLPVLEVGSGTRIEYGYTTTATRFFLRLRYSDLPSAEVRAADFDHDGLSNWTEIQASLDAFSLDTDQDGLGDYSEYVLGISGLRSGDSDGDGVIDSLDAYPADATRSVYSGTFSIQVAAPSSTILLP